MSIEQKKVRVRIALAVNPDGEWFASGCGSVDDALNRDAALDGLADCSESGSTDDACVHFVEADVPVPKPLTIPGEVKPCV